jgi:protein-tyrosine-phosphatase
MIERMKVHFICRGNVLRSLIAETYLKSLKIDGIDVISSGTNVNWDDAQERQYFANTLEVLKRHKIITHAKSQPNQLDQTRVDEFNDIIVLMNERVADEANRLVKFPVEAHNWMIVDIGEGDRTNEDEREQYEEAIYQEITKKVDGLFPAQ